jgi:hypothetical protein
VAAPLWEGIREGCGTCVFWGLPPVNGSMRLCRRYPPAPLVVTYHRGEQPITEVEHHQPWMNQDDWCGEYKREMPER